MKAQNSVGRPREASPHRKTSNRSSTPRQGTQRPGPIQTRSVKPPNTTRPSWKSHQRGDSVESSQLRPTCSCNQCPQTFAPIAPVPNAACLQTHGTAKAAAAGPRYKYFSKPQLRNQRVNLYARPCARITVHLTAHSLSHKPLPVISSPSPAEPSAPHPAAVRQTPAAPRPASQPRHYEHAPRPDEM